MQFSCRHLSKTYNARGKSVTALADITFDVGEHEFVCIVGPSGCGKTTLLKIIADLLKPTTGDIVFANGHTPRRATVFQEHGLFPWLTVADNVAFGLEMLGIDRTARLDRARAMIDQFGLRSFADHYPHELSIGMRQRAGIARAFLIDPDILLMDEPFGSLDAQTRLILQEELLKIWMASRKSVLYITHDIEEAILLGDRVLVMTGRPGSIRADIPIPIDRPRQFARAIDEAVIEIKWQIWKMLEAEVRTSLSPTT
jgi:NitT/TauT family transport system ATP-binding protein